MPGSKATPLVRRARAALFAGAISATAVAGVACSKEAEPAQTPPTPQPTSEPSAVAMYGAVAPPMAADAGEAIAPDPQPTATAISMYGAPPMPRKP
ncbi:hypothetical protein BH09MYX1_BH09MYX1_68380 [soil metagenome]